MPDHSPDSEDSGELPQEALHAGPHSSINPSIDPVTNLLIADIVVRGASTLFRKSVEKRVAKTSTRDEDEDQHVVDGRTVITTLGLYGASKLATRSLPGLFVVTGGLLAKALYDRGKSRQRRLNSQNAGTCQE